MGTFHYNKIWPASPLVTHNLGYGNPMFMQLKDDVVPGVE